MERETWLARFPWSLAVCAALLIVCGLAAIARAESLAGAPARFWPRQAVWAVVSLAVMFLVTWPNYRRLGDASYLLYGLSLGLLGLVYLFPPINGAHRWLRLSAISFQPSELAKLTCVLALARYLMHRRSQATWWGLAAPFGIAAAPLLLILKEPDLGTALVFLPALFAMLWAAGARTRDLAAAAGLAALLLPLVWLAMSREQRSRVTALFEDTSPGARLSDDTFQLYHSKQTIALGGAWGTWWSGDDLEDLSAHRLPEGHSDFAFAVFVERFGWPGAGLVLGLHVLLAGRGLAVALRLREPFGRLLAVGLLTVIATQAVVNSAMTVGLAPVTGLPLPLVSYGGSSLLATCVSLGLVLNVGLRPGYELAGEPFQFSRAA